MFIILICVLALQNEFRFAYSVDQYISIQIIHYKNVSKTKRTVVRDYILYNNYRVGWFV